MHLPGGLLAIARSVPCEPVSTRKSCETVLVSHEVRIPPDGVLADVRLTIEDLPPVAGKLRVLVRHPAFESGLELASDEKADFDKVLGRRAGRALPKNAQLSSKDVA